MCRWLFISLSELLQLKGEGVGGGGGQVKFTQFLWLKSGGSTWADPNEKYFPLHGRVINLFDPYAHGPKNYKDTKP